MYREFELQPSRTEGTGSGDGPDVKTIQRGRPNLFRRTNPRGGDARIYLDITGGGGAAMTLDIDVIGIINGKRQILASFPQQTVAALAVLTVTEAPDELSTAFVVGGTTPTYTYNIQVTRS